MSFPELLTALHWLVMRQRLMTHLIGKPGTSFTKGGFRMTNGFLTNMKLLIVFTNSSFFTSR